MDRGWLLRQFCLKRWMHYGSWLAFKMFLFEKVNALWIMTSFYNVFVQNGEYCLDHDECLWRFLFEKVNIICCLNNDECLCRFLFGKMNLAWIMANSNIVMAFVRKGEYCKDHGERWRRFCVIQSQQNLSYSSEQRIFYGLWKAYIILIVNV